MSTVFVPELKEGYCFRVPVIVTDIFWRFQKCFYTEGLHYIRTIFEKLYIGIQLFPMLVLTMDGYIDIETIQEITRTKFYGAYWLLENVELIVSLLLRQASALQNSQLAKKGPWFEHLGYQHFTFSIPKQSNGSNAANLITKLF